MKLQTPMALAVAVFCLTAVTGYSQAPALTPAQEAERALRGGEKDAGGPKPAASEDKEITTANTCLQEALDSIDSVASRSATPDDKVRAKGKVRHLLAEAKAALSRVNGSGANQAKKLIDNALAGLPRQDFNYNTYGLKRANWDTRKTQGDIEKAIKQLKL